MFNVDFLTIVKEADDLDNYDTMYVSSNVGWQTNYKMAEILTQYACQIDALYYQEESTKTGGRDLLPYSERYHFVDMKSQNYFDANALYVIHQNDLKYFTNTSFDTILTQGNFMAINLH